MFALEGADSLIVYLPEEEKDAQDTQKRVEDQDVKCHLFAADLSKKQNCQTAIDRAVERMGGLDILVNNLATQQMYEDIQDLPDETWERTIDTNLHSFFYMSKYALPHLRSGSTIINCSSINAYTGRPDLLDYTTSKGAIVAFTRGLSNQQIAKGIRVNCVCPGPVWTPLVPATMSREAQDQFTSPMGRPGQPSEIATCFVFLASQDSSFISGQCLHPNGGTVVNG